MGIRALTLHRPWDRLILHNGKDVENRVWSTTYRGDLLVHAGLEYDGEGAWIASEILDDDGGTWTVDNGVTGLVGVVTLWATCAQSVQSDRLVCDCGSWAMPGHYHFRLRRPRPFAQAIPARGYQRLWIPSPDLVSAIASALNDAEAAE